ncbi:hypothetical protein UlMin_007302 [Ulmus minor]
MQWCCHVSSCLDLLMFRSTQIDDLDLLDFFTAEDGTISLENSDGTNSHYLPSFPNDSLDDSSFHSLKRARKDDGHMFSTSTSSEDQKIDFGNHSFGLTHHLSLPANFGMLIREKVLQFETSAPCKLRAKRGFATHPRSIAERNRRSRISDGIKKLQDLFPEMDKQTNTADMLALAVEYIKDLQKQVKRLNDKKVKCSCA